MMRLAALLLIALGTLRADSKSDQIARLQAQLDEARRENAALIQAKAKPKLAANPSTSANTEALGRNTMAVEGQTTAAGQNSVDEKESRDRLTAALTNSARLAEITAQNAAAASHDKYIFLGLVVTALVAMFGGLLTAFGPRLAALQKTADETHALSNGSYGIALKNTAAALQTKAAALLVIANMTGTEKAALDHSEAEGAAKQATTELEDHQRVQKELAEKAADSAK